MTQASNSASHPSFSLAKRMIAGAILGFMVISLFVFGVDNPPAAWGKLWMIRPLLVVPMAGAMGGFCNYFIFQYRGMIGLNKVVAAILSFLVAFVGLWLGIVLGLDGTLWD